MVKNIMFIAGNCRSLIANRGDLIADFSKIGYQVFAVVPEYDYLEEVENLGVKVVSVKMRRSGLNFFNDLLYSKKIYDLLKVHQISIVFSYGIKPVIYGSLAAKFAKCQVITSMITGLGYLFTGEDTKRRILRKIGVFLYKLAFKSCHLVFFQNPDDLALFKKLGILHTHQKTSITNGSGVNLKKFPNSPVENKLPVSFLMIARLLNDKGVKEYYDAARSVKAKYPNTIFTLVGGYDDSLPHAIDEKLFKEIKESEVMDYYDHTRDVYPYLKSHHVFVLPSYREGTPRSVLEAMAVARPIVTTDVPGCRSTVIPNENGFLVEAKTPSGLIEAFESFIDTPSIITTMGKASYTMVKEKFDVEIVNKNIIKEIEKCID